MAKDKGHAWYYHNKVGKQVCDKCGLIYLRNKRTARAVRRPCPGKEDGDE